MRQDDILLNKVIEEAGLLSRAAARTKAVGGAVRQGIGDVATAISGKKPAPDAGWRGKYRVNKQEQILKTLSKDILTDLTKLGLLPQGSPLNQQELQNVLTQYVGKYTGVGRQQPTQSNTSSSQLPSNLQNFRVGQQLPSTATQTTQPQTTPEPPTQAQSSAPAWRDVFPKGGREATSTSTPTTPSTPTPKPATQASAEDQIPNESTISDKKGNTYEYSSDDNTWYVRSKTGGSLSEIPNNTPEIQNSITKAWSEKSKTEKTQASKASSPEFLKPGEKPEEEIPNESTISDKKGNAYEYSAEDKTWYIRSKTGGSLTAIPNDSEVIQNSISKAWRNKKKKESTQEAPAFEESFKNYFWTK